MAIKFLSGVNLSNVTAGSILKLDSNGNIVAATAGTDYVASSTWSTASNSNIYYNSGGVRIGTYQASVDAAAQLHVFDYQTTDPKILIEDGNTGDASMQFKISTQSYVMGIDNSDADKFKFSSSTAFGTNNIFTINTNSVSFLTNVFNTGTINTRGNDYGILNTYGSLGNSYAPQEGGTAAVRYWVMFDYTNNASYPFLTNRTPSGAVVIKTGTAAGGGENEHFRIKGGDGTVDAYFTNTNVGIGTTAPEGTLDVVGSTINGTAQADWSNDGVSYNTYGDLTVSRRHGATKDSDWGFTGPLIDLRSSNAGSEWSVAQILGTVDPLGGSNHQGGLAFLTSGGGTTNPTGRRDKGAAPQVRMLIGADGTTYMQGNVGIGTTSPSEKLHVVGNGVFHSGANLGRIKVGRSANQEIEIYVDDTNNIITAYQDSDSNSSHVFALDREFDGSGANYFEIRKGGSAQLHIDTDGNVGIGTTSPVQTLVVDKSNSGSVGGYIRVQNEIGGSGSNVGIDFATFSPQYYSESVTSTDPVARIKATDTGAYSGRLDIQVRGTGTGGTLSTIGTFNNNGNVGIGTTSPAQKLHVDGNIRVNDVNDNIFSNRFSALSNASVYLISNSGHPIILSAGGTEKMRLTSSGNMGIGTNSPSHKLDVNGTARFHGNQTHLRPILSKDYGNEMIGIDRVGTASFSSNITIGYQVFRTGDSYAYFSDGNPAVFTIEDITIGSTSSVYARELIVYMHGYFSGDFKIEVKKSDGTWVTAINQTSTTLGGGDWHRFLPNWSSVAPYPAAWSLKGLRFTFSNYTSGSNVYVGQLGITNTQHYNTMPYYNKFDGLGYGNLTLKTSTDSSVSHGLIVQRSSNGDQGYINYQGGAFQFRATNGDPIVFGTVSNERVRILSGGNVGIGTTNPGSLLSIRATTASHQLVRINRPNSDTAALYLGNNSSNDAIISGNNAPISLGKDVSGTYTEYVNIATDGELKFSAYGAGILKTNASGIVSLDTNTYLTSVDVDWNDIDSINGIININSTTQIGQGDTETLVSFQNSGTERGRFEVDDSANSYFVATGFKTTGSSTGLLKSDGTIDTSTYATTADINSFIEITDVATYLSTNNYVTTSYTGFVAVAGDTMTGNLSFNDNGKVILGTGSDFEMFHNGSNTFLQTTTGSVGDLYITARGTNHDLYLEAADDIFIRPQGNESGIDVIGNGAVKLYYDGAMKLETTSDGINVPGVSQLGATCFYFHDVGVGDADGLDVKWTLKDKDGNDVTSTSTGVVYRLRLVTLGTGTNTGAVYICDNVDGAGWRTKKVASVDGGAPNSNFPFVEIDGGVPKVTIEHNSTYNVRVFVEAFIGGNGGASYTMLGLDSGITNENGSVLMSLSSSTTEATSVMIGTDNILRKRELGSNAFTSTTYAPLASPGLTGTPTAPTAAAGTNTTQIATTAFVSTAVSNLVDSAPAALDTLNELAAALGDDANFSTTVTTSIGTKVSKSGDTMTGALEINGNVGANPILKLYNTSNSNGATLQFSDQSTQTQTGNITFRHADSQSEGGGASFNFESEPDTVLVVGNNTNKGRIAVYSSASDSEVDYGFAGDVNTGMLRTSADNVSLVAGGVRGVGVGTTAVSLKYAGTTKLATTTSGIDISGEIQLGGDSEHTISRITTSNITSEVTDVTQIEGRQIDLYAYDDVWIRSGSTDDIGFEAGGATRLFIKNDGNVGIGTTNPGSKLEVAGEAKVTSLLISDSNSGLLKGHGDAYHGIMFRGTPSGATTYGITAGDQISFYEYGGEFRFYQKNNVGGGTLSEVARIHHTNSFFDSNVGIGTTSPGGKLHLEGNFESGKALVIKGTYGTDTEYYFRTHGTNSEYLALYAAGTRIMNFNSGIVDTYKGLRLFGGAISTGTSNHLVIGSSVQIGQGDEDPVIEFKYGTTSLGKIDQFGDIHAGGFKVSGTTGFLKSDGSVDTSTYASSTHNHNSDYLSQLGGYYDADFTWDGTHDFSNVIKVSGATATTTNTTALFYGTNGVIEKRDLGSNAFNSTSYLPLAGGTVTGDLTIDTGTTGSTTQVYSAFDTLTFNNQYNTIAAGPNKIIMYDDGAAWKGGFGIHDGTVAYYSGNTHKWYKTGSGPGGYTFTERMTLDGSGNLSVDGTFSASGYNNTNWDTAYGWGNHASANYLTSYTETSTLGQVLTRGNSTNNTIHIYHTDRAYTFQTDTNWGGWARTPFYFEDGSGNGFGGLGAYGGNGTTLSKYYIGSAYNSNIIEFHTDNSVIMSGNLTLPDKIIHSGDTDTYIKFDADRVRIVAGNVTKFDSNTIYTGTVQSVSGAGTVSGLTLTSDDDSVDPTLTLGGSITTPVSGDWWNNGFPKVGTDGVMEIGKYIDFHDTDTETDDFSYRITASNTALTFSGALSVPEFIYHTGDSNTYVWLTADRIRLVAGGTTKLDTSNTYLLESTDISVRNITARDIVSAADRTYSLGTDANRWAVVFCETLDSAGQHESKLQNPEGETPIGEYETGTVLVWKGGKNVPCTTAADHMRMGIAVKGTDSPLVQGAEPVLCTGEVKEGDYLVTSTTEGHAEAISPEFMRQHMLFDCVIGKALEDGAGESHLVKTWINI